MQKQTVDIISALKQMDGTFATREQRVADYVNANMERISEMTIANLAEAVGVSSPTVIRFCRSLGCEGFRDFKLKLAQNLAVSLQYLGPEAAVEAAKGASAIDRILGALYATANVMRQQIDPASLEAAQARLAETRTLLVLGLGGGSTMVANEAANRFFRLGIPAVAVSDSYLMQMRAATLGPEDTLLIISNSGEARELICAAEIASGYGAKVIVISKPKTTLETLADYAITANLPEDPDIHKPTASRYAHLVLIDAIALAVAQSRADLANENLRRIRASLTAYHGQIGAQPLGD
ncbi:MurR/RpiR family transcriptional regulator [Cohaesibacter sp. CAU 1516]|uniref:MurR/RpiR family transcriptional regulator n=1 Tax=Cohaesibacter sp. CAU 1516 TaxID=2576038 RepID=UPI0010FCFA50|nr:MurR/RpiR family transcriptional regulator [Cohaesibacter sp. CAU 1516]TLP44344.1 MurR/RpiR family transcriptional regulator [Cohaesibacter sp. CAU 1516]